MYKSTLRSILPRLRAYRKIYFALKFIWLNFYTMKFSRFRFSVLLNVIILTQPVNIVKHFFLFYQLFAKSMWGFQCRLFCDSLIIISNCIRLVKNIFKLFSNASAWLREKSLSALKRQLIYITTLAALCQVPFSSFFAGIWDYFVHSLAPYLHCFNLLDAISLLFLSYIIIFAL